MRRQRFLRRFWSNPNTPPNLGGVFPSIAVLLRCLIWAAICALIFASPRSLFPQAVVRNRIASGIEGTPSATIRGHLHPLAHPQYDRGKVAGLFAMSRVTMMFKPADSQQSELNALLQEQQNPASPNYHRWLTAQEFADRFGLSNDDLGKTISWLQDQGFTIDEIGPGRNWLSFSGSAQQMESAFQTKIHEYAVNGETHYATATEPSVPRALAKVVLGFRSLHDFRPKPRGIVKPKFTSSATGNHFIVPDDFATIYSLHDLYNNGIDGTGQKIAVMGQTDIQLQDIRTFRSLSGLPARDPQVILVPGSKDPGVVNGDIGEADLDIEWAGAVARNAAIVYVNSSNGVFDSLQYAIGHNVAPVVTISYGDCEPNWSASDVNTLLALAQQANAQGMTIVAPAGDGGAADCDSDFSGRLFAREGLAVDFPGSLPYVTSVGGTQFNELGPAWNTDHSFGNFFRKPQPDYWRSANNGSNGSALSYIPEIAWNTTLLDGQLAATGGGRSILFPKPTWQVGNGVPNDNVRDVPDISFGAAVDHDGYLTCSLGDCVSGFRAADGTLDVVGGTSMGSPLFAGIVALINQMTNSSQGNVNPMLYQLAALAPDAFHDITQGGNQVPCRPLTPDCPNSGFLGYTAGTGYDLATGLGSVNVLKLLTAWPTVAAASTTAKFHAGPRNGVTD
jgi:subtilase family serine protease